MKKILFVCILIAIKLNLLGQIYGEIRQPILKKNIFNNLSKALRNNEDVLELHLTNQNLNEFPIDILKLKNLKYLILDSNSISDIPTQIGILNELVSISLTNNKIKTIPKSLGSLIKLKYLFLDFNEIQSLPSELFNLPNLEVLYINNNQINKIPISIKYLNNIKTLVASDNKIDSLPIEIGYLYNLNKLDLSNNNLKYLPDIFYQIKSLENVWLSNNKLKIISDKLSNLQNLTTLALNNNEITILTKSIGKLIKLNNLFIDNNKLGSLPESVGELYGLKKLFIGNNSIKEIPTTYSNLINLEKLEIENLSFTSFPQVLYDINNNGTKIIGLKTKELFNSKLLLSQARNKVLTSNLAEAQINYEKLIKLDTNNVDALVEYASLLIDASEFDKASLICKKALTKNISQDKLEKLRRLLNNADNKTNKIDDLINTYKSNIKKDSTNPELYYELGIFYFNQNNYSEANYSFSKAIQYNSSHINSIFYKSVIALSSEEVENFIFHALRFMYLEPKSKKTQTTFPFLMSRMKMRTGIKGKNNSYSYNDSYIIRNENNDVVYKSKSTSAELLLTMLQEVLMNDDKKTENIHDSLTNEVLNTVLYKNKKNIEIFQLELRRICETVTPENKTINTSYLNYYSNLIKNGYLEAFANLIMNIRDKENETWIKENSKKIDEFNIWTKNYKW